jgi:hypothetical protein
MMDKISRGKSLQLAMERYSGSNNKLLLRVYKCLQEAVDDDYILDSAKGVKMDDKWIFRPPGSTKRALAETDRVAMLSIADVGKFVDWVNRLCIASPGSAEDHYVYWSSVDKGNIYMANVAAFMTGAKLFEHTSDAASKTELVDRLLNAMRRLNRETTRAAASGLANGITKFYYVILKCGEDAAFKSKFSVRSFRNKTKQACSDLIERIRGMGDGRMDIFFNGLLEGHPLKPILEATRQLVLKHRAALGVKMDNSSVSDSSRSSEGDTSSDEAETSSDDGDDESVELSSKKSSSDSEYHSDVENHKMEEESESETKDSAAEDADAGSAKDEGKPKDGPSATIEEPFSIPETPPARSLALQQGHKRVRLGAITRNGRRIAQRAPSTRSQRNQMEAT